jgi:putative SOS response-associated peptidase YedK
MCGRYLTPDEAAIERHWSLAAPAGFRQSYNVAPSQLAPVIRMDEQGRRDMTLLTWGFQPAWAKRAWINARAETVFTAQAFAAAAAKRRCLVPAMGWYEWQSGATPKQPYAFHLGGFTPFAFAGIWTARKVDEAWLRSFAIITTEAGGPLREIHERKPLVLEQEKYESWLRHDTSVADARELLAGDFAGICAYPVSTYVNKPENDDARCIRPFESPAGMLKLGGAMPTRGE